ncbi:MAG: CPBP family glutamic-type intramembrane protease [Janthinobacterium lividum]
MALEQPVCLVLLLTAMILACNGSNPRSGWLLLSVGFYLTNGILLVIPQLFPGLHVGHWNWTGKFLGILGSLCWIRLTGLSYEEVGLQLPRGSRGWIISILGILLMAACSTWERLVAGAQPYGTEMFVFQATMPGLDEELAYRGILFALLLRGFTSKLGQGLSAAVVVIMFWLAHVVSIEAGAFHITTLKPDVLLASVLFMGLRLLTGSVFVTIAAHNIDNVANIVG